MNRPDIVDRLSRGEAFTLATGRGYQGTLVTFSKDSEARMMKPWGIAIVEPGDRQTGRNARNYFDLGE